MVSTRRYIGITRPVCVYKCIKFIRRSGAAQETKGVYILLCTYYTDLHYGGATCREVLSFLNHLSASRHPSDRFKDSVTVQRRCSLHAYGHYYTEVPILSEVTAVYIYINDLYSTRRHPRSEPSPVMRHIYCVIIICRKKKRNINNRSPYKHLIEGYTFIFNNAHKIIP